MFPRFVLVTAVALSAVFVTDALPNDATLLLLLMRAASVHAMASTRGAVRCSPCYWCCSS